MDPQELAALLGFPADPAQGEAGTGDLSAPPPTGMELADPFQYSYQPIEEQRTTTDFAPQTYDFGNEQAQTYEYSPQGDLLETLPSGAKVSIGQKSGESGYSPEKMAQIEAGPMGSSKMDQKAKGHRAQTEANYGGIKQAMAQTQVGGVTAIKDVGGATAARMLAEAKGNQKIATMYEQHAADIKAVSESTLIAKQQAKDEYRAKLMEIPEVNPNALWDEADGGHRFGMVAAAFVHDFLGAKGIKTSAMDTINRAISNKIDAQVANINAKKQVAAGFKDLYEMTVQESASQMEVKAKMQGYMLKAMEAGVTSDLGKYDANIARAKTGLAVNEFRQAGIKNMIEVERYIDQAADQAAQRDIQIRGQNIQASIAKQNNANELEIAKLRAGSGKEEVNPLAGILMDVSESGGGLVARRFLPDVKEEKRFEIREKSGAMAGTLWGIRKLRELHKEAGSKADYFGDTRIAGEATRAANVMSKYAQLSLAYAKSGKQLSEKEINHYETMFRNPTWFTNGDNIRQLGKLQEALAKEMQVTVAPHTVKVGAGDPLHGVKLGTAEEYFGAEAVEGAKYGAEDKGIPAPTTAGTAMQSLGQPGSRELQAQPLDKEKELWEDFKKANPKAATVLSRGERELAVAETDVVKPTAERRKKLQGPPQAHADVYLLALSAWQGDDEAANLLSNLANPEKDAPKDKKELEPLADYYVDWVARQKKPLSGAYTSRPEE